MDIAAFSQLGIGPSTLLLLWFVARFFIETLTKKDEQISKIVEEFTVTIANHIVHETVAQNKTAKALENLTEAISKWAKPK